jgi:hypothetical protein
MGPVHTARYGFLKANSGRMWLGSLPLFLVRAFALRGQERGRVGDGVRLTGL